ncbi:4-hydroxybenzoate polyprenyltransferase [Aliiruegeria haliotis]|uniref:4-hydroxybenzoate polyprenyltransferase n=1 Tax=Aliiruegeria haliotis TaxID=1280846 RepID=A0A2T0RR32_9RHOB|nr:UbiA family prenyltransferase [Aliiruegeria haliotis]PRY23553.1 4-hydroxybenzoate polyprenyltransferase [Aliiruegeria haliotis]
MTSPTDNMGPDSVPRPQSTVSEPSEDALPVLAVDLDGTLLRSDMLLETWWSAVSDDVRVAVPRALTLLKGKAAFKAALRDVSSVDVAALPYNAEVLAYIKQHRAQGGRVALVTASDQAIADAVADHLNCFEDVLGSDGQENLKGATKAATLVERYGERGFDYIGDHPADVAVWRHARKAITVDAPAKLRGQADDVSLEAEHLGDSTSASTARTWLKACRPHQWVKNILVFLPALMAHSADGGQWLAATLAFVTFSMVASSVYLLNDLLDLSADRAHPRKRYRALPSGNMKLIHGSLLAPALLVTGLGLSMLFLPGRFTLVLLAYFCLTSAYSLTLKRQLVIDICTLATLYTTRIIAGGAAANVDLSPWLLAFSIFLFLSLAAIKRQAELISDFAAGREGSSGRAYVTGDLPIIAGMAISAGYLAVLVMALYVNSPIVTQYYTSPLWLWLICPILLYWVSRAVMLTHRGQMHDDPVVFALKDKMSRLCAVLIICIGFVATFV